MNTTDEILIKTLPGFSNGIAQVNGITLHFVTGGDGPPLVLLRGRPSGDEKLG